MDVKNHCSLHTLHQDCMEGAFTVPGRYFMMFRSFPRSNQSPSVSSVTFILSPSFLKIFFSSMYLLQSYCVPLSVAMVVNFSVLILYLILKAGQFSVATGAMGLLDHIWDVHFTSHAGMALQKPPLAPGNTVIILHLFNICLR